jgi:hypothetical protein
MYKFIWREFRMGKKFKNINRKNRLGFEEFKL